jgi:hypothetical protein
MNINLNKIAKDLYGKIETRFTDIKIGDENAEVLSKKTDIPEARFFEFEYKHNGVPLGTITITLDDDDGVIVQISGDLAEKKHPGVFKFIRGLRQFAKDRLLNFDVQNIGKDNLDKRDYEFQAKPKEEPMEPIMESKLYGTTRLSYQDLGEARLVIKHSQAINPDLPAGRTMHVDSIYVENADGERFRYPYKHINGARALAEHIKHGGNPYDSIGKHICSLSEELAQLRKFKGYVSRNEALSEAMGDITSKVFERIEQIKKEVNMLQRSGYYEQFAESFEDREEQMIPEDIMSDWIDRLTIRTFNEELKTAFPYIFRLVDESEIPVKDISPDEMLDELRSEEKDKDGKVIRWKEEGEWKKSEKKDPKGKIFNLSDKARRETEKMSKESIQPEDQFESFLDRLMNEDEDDQEGHNTLFSKDVSVRTQAIENLKQALGSEMLTVQTAPDELKSLLPMDQFQEYLEDQDPDAGPEVVKGLVVNYLNDLSDGKIDNPLLGSSAAEIASMVIDQVKLTDVDDTLPQDMNTEPGAGATPPAPAPAPAPDMAATGPGAPAPDLAAPPAAAPGMPPGSPPLAENKARIIKAIHKAMECGADMDTKLDFGHKEMTLHDAIRECGLDPRAMSPRKESGVEEILQSISGFYNKNAMNEGNFTIGGTRVKTKILKHYKNGEYKHANPADVRKVCKLVDKLDPPSSTQGALSHIKKMAGLHDTSYNVAEDPNNYNLDVTMKHLHSMQDKPHMEGNMDATTMMKALMQKLS